MIVDLPPVRVTLPVSGLDIGLRQPTGAEDLLLADHDIGDPGLVLALAAALAASDTTIDWAELTVSDADTLMMRLRQMMLGDAIGAASPCDRCGEQVEFSFGIAAYLAHHRPAGALPGRRGWQSRAGDEPGWYRLYRDDHEIAAFRLPTLGDQIAAWRQPDAGAVIAARCIRASAPGSPIARADAPVLLAGGGGRERSEPSGAAGPPQTPPASGRGFRSTTPASRVLRRRAEAEMARRAPLLAGPLAGTCPECATALTVRFEARSFCLQELRDRARHVYDDVDVLAGRYHWSRESILTLPHRRRASFAERARQAAAA